MEGASFQTHLDRLDTTAQAIMKDLRAFVLALGPQVIEEIRPHRIAYSKTINFRVFLEVFPAKTRLELTVRSGGKGSAPVRLEVSNTSESEKAKGLISLAFERA